MSDSFSQNKYLFGFYCLAERTATHVLRHPLLAGMRERNNGTRSLNVLSTIPTGTQHQMGVPNTSCPRGPISNKYECIFVGGKLLKRKAGFF